MSDNEDDEDYVPPPKLKSQSKKKRRASRLLCVECARSARRVRLSDVLCLDQCLILLFFMTVVGTIMSHLSSLLHEHLKVGTSFFFLVACGFFLVGVLLSMVLLFSILCICYHLVADPVTGAGFESSGVGDVFVCEQAQDSPAVESEVISMLPEDGGQCSRTQHGRAAVGVEPSVIYNAWENGTVFLCSVPVIFVFGSQSRLMSSQVVCGFPVLLSVGVFV